MRKRSLILTLCLAAGALPLAALETEGGIHGSLIFPQNDLHTAVGGRIGFQVGVQSGIDFGGGNELRPRIDYTRLDGGSFSLTSMSSTTTVQAVGVGVDYLRYLEEQRRGLYGVAGVSLNWWETHYRFTGNDRETSPSFMLGAGQRFNSSWSMEFNLEWGQFRPTMGSAGQIKAGVFYHF